VERGNINISPPAVVDDAVAVAVVVVVDDAAVAVVVVDVVVVVVDVARGKNANAFRCAQAAIVGGRGGGHRRGRVGRKVGSGLTQCTDCIQA
jgi:hypothetical protein